MLDKWNVFNETTFAGVLTYDTEKKTFLFELKNESLREYASAHLNFDKDQNWFRETLFDRVAPPNRVNIREILRRHGILQYDAWELLKACNFSTVDDAFWMTKSMDPNEYYYKCVWGELERRRRDGTLPPDAGVAQGL